MLLDRSFGFTRAYSRCVLGTPCGAAQPAGPMARTARAIPAALRAPPDGVSARGGRRARDKRPPRATARARPPTRPSTVTESTSRMRYSRPDAIDATRRANKKLRIDSLTPRQDREEESTCSPCRPCPPPRPWPRASRPHLNLGEFHESKPPSSGPIRQWKLNSPELTA